MKRLPIISIVTAAALVAILLVYLVTFQVRFSESVVRVRFGEAKEVIDKPGLYFKWPAPIETVRAYDTRLRVLDTPESELKTQDGQNLIIGCTAFWKVDQPMRFHSRVTSERAAEDTLRTRVNEARNSVVGRHAMSDFVNLDSKIVADAHDAMYKEILDAAGPGLLADYGVRLIEVRIRRITVPDDATQAIQAAMASERGTQATRFTEEGKSIAETIKANAKTEAEKIRQFAARRAAEIESVGVSASERMLSQIRSEDSELFIWLRYLEALQIALKTKTTIFLDSQSDIFKPFAQPLGAGDSLSPVRLLDEPRLAEPTKSED